MIRLTVALTLIWIHTVRLACGSRQRRLHREHIATSLFLCLCMQWCFIDAVLQVQAEALKREQE